jgi:hypothetical protein
LQLRQPTADSGRTGDQGEEKVMADETKKPAADTEISDEELTQVAGGGPHVKVFDGRTMADGEPETLAHEATHVVQGNAEVKPS